jgi:hypothetical protein
MVFWVYAVNGKAGPRQAAGLVSLAAFGCLGCRVTLGRGWRDGDETLVTAM